MPKTSLRYIWNYFATFTRPRGEDYFIFVAVMEGRIVGTVADQLHGRIKGSIDDAYVKPAFRRKGVMRELENYAIKLLKEHGAATVELNVRADNKEGMGTWPTLGYEPFKIIMRKRI